LSVGWGAAEKLTTKADAPVQANPKRETKNERDNMSKKFDELAKGLAQSLTRRQALKRFSVGLAGIALACFGLAPKTEAGACLPLWSHCGSDQECCSGRCSKSKASFFGFHVCY
jgi:hypothetical protein